MPPLENIREKAATIGIDAWAVIPCSAVEANEISAFRRYIQKGFHGNMSYLERNTEKRFNPALLYPGCRSMIIILCRYKPLPGADPHKARFAQGEDYHITTKNKLHMLATELGLAPDTYRAFCDTAPLLEKYWAAKAGLGFIARNSLLLNPVLGSFFSIGILLTKKEFGNYTPLIPSNDFRPDGGNPLHPCNNCRACIDACPVHALGADGNYLEARKCNAYLTVEKRGEPSGSTPYTFGCDICQNVCPANR